MRAAISLGILVTLAFAAPALATDLVNREQDIIQLRLGQHIQVDDGSCPTGQIKEVQGATLAANGTVSRTRKCVPRNGIKTR